MVTTMNDPNAVKCAACDQPPHPGIKSQWWHLRDYYGVSGWVCRTCFNKVRHVNDKPVHPVVYRNIMKKLKGNLTSD
jgi:hypothetical protein